MDSNFENIVNSILEKIAEGYAKAKADWQADRKNLFKDGRFLGYYEAKEALLKQLAADGMTMVVVTHEMNFARDVADRVIYMENGLVVEDGPAKEVLGINRSAAIRAFAGDVDY